MTSSLGLHSMIGWRTVSIGTALFLLAASVSRGADRPAHSDEVLFARGRPRVYAGEHLQAIRFPVGGIGTGTIDHDGVGLRPGWTIFDRAYLPVEVNLPGFEPVPGAKSSGGAGVVPGEPPAAPYFLAFIPDSFFAVRVQAGADRPQVRALQTLGAGPFAAFADLTFRGEYPFGWYHFREPNLPVQVSLEVFNPLLPGEVKDSAIPCAIYSITVENTSDREVQAAVLAAQQNPGGYSGGKRTVRGRFAKEYGGNINTIVRQGDAALLHLMCDRPATEAGYGDLALAVRGSHLSGAAAFDNLAALERDFAEDGRLDGSDRAGPSPAGETVEGALAESFALPPGARHTVTFVLTWYFPNAVHGGREGKVAQQTGIWAGEGNRYANWWPDAAAVARYVLADLDRLRGLTRLYHDTLYETNVPIWLLDRLSAGVVPLRTKTCWWARDGYFGCWEGCGPGTGSCPGNCNHVWQYAQSPARLWPEIARRLREQELRYQHPDGGIPFRQPTAPNTYASQSFPATDGQFGSILAVYREYLMSADGRWLESQWPKVKKAMDFAIETWDANEDGVLSGQQHTTLDCRVGGSTPWLGTMYLAALAAVERMARVQGDEEMALRCHRIAQVGARREDETLFNGQYFIQVLDGSPRDWYTEHGYTPEKWQHPAYAGGQNYLTGCGIDQLLGQWWANQLHLGWLYPPEHERTALQSLFRYNFQPSFRGFEHKSVTWVADDDGGMILFSWPAGLPAALKGKKLVGYYDTTMSGFEYAAAATMIQAGLLREGFTILKAVSDRYDGRLRTGLHRSCWGYSGNPFGDDESGKFYARAQSVWSVLLACQGFIYNGPAGVLGFAPVWSPEDHRSFFTAATAWGLFTQRRQESCQTETIAVRYGTLPLKTVQFELPEAARHLSVQVRRGPSILAATMAVEGRMASVIPAEPLVIRAGEELTVEFSW